jgi:hypothetical protein
MIKLDKKGLLYEAPATGNRRRRASRHARNRSVADLCL